MILVQFANRAAVGSTAADWHDRYFGPTGSVADYYTEVSYGNFSVSPASETYGTPNDGIAGWVTLPYDHPNTGVTRNGTSDRQIVRDAVLAVDPWVNFAAYDTNANGRIETRELHVTVIAAGYETSYGGASAACAPGVWGHQWTVGVTVAAPVVDGKTVAGFPGGGYTMFGEWHCSNTDTPGHFATLGIMVHEIGHDIGWPDLYDTKETKTHNGVGRWSVMSNGSWLRTGTNPMGSMPSHPDAFMKYYQGWVTPTAVTGTQSVSIAAASSSGSVVRLLDNPGGVDWSFGSAAGTGEYFLIENRQRSGYDSGLPACGLLIWHIDETRPGDSTANRDESRKLVDLEEADGLAQLDHETSFGDAGDPYPGTSANSTFNAASNPSSVLYSGAPSGASVSGISATCSATMQAISTISSSSICPPDDALEPNNSRAAATATTSGQARDGIACDDDYFSIAASAGQSLAANLTFTHAGGDLDMRLYDAAGTQVGLSTSVTDNEAITYAVPTTGTYVVRVYPFDGVANKNRYSLTATVTTPLCPPDDALEPNNSRAAATATTSGQARDGIACDDDYFSIAASAGQSLAANLTFTHARGDLDMRLYDAAGTQVALADSTTDNEAIAYAVPTTGTYYVRIYPYNGVANKNQYSLTVTVTGQPQSATRKPDGRIRKGSGAYVGNNIYNATAVDQTRTGAKARGLTITFGISIQNDGTGPDRFRLNATGATTTMYRVRYFRGTTEITAAVVAGTYQTPLLGPGATYLIKAKVKVKSTATVGSSVTRLATITSVTDGTKIDAVKFIGKRA